MRTRRNTALKVPCLFTPTFPSVSREMLNNSSNFTIAGGTFNVWERPRSPPTDFRSIRLGDLNLLTQIGDEEALTFDVVERRGPRLVQRRAIVGTRKVYRARIFGSQDPMTAVVYEGSQLQKAIYNGSWKAEIESRQSLRFPFVPQLFGITESRGVNALIYHDGIVHSPVFNKGELTSTTTEFITIAQFRQLHHGSPLVSEYIEYQMVHIFLQPIEYYSTESQRGGMRLRIELSVRDHIPLGKLETVSGDFHVHFPNVELAKIELRVEPWIAHGAPIETDITALDTQWTRIVVPAGSEKEVNFVSYNSIPDARYMRKSWISQALRLLESGIVTGVKLDDLLLIDAVYLSMRLHYPAQNTDPPSKLPYLFVSSPAARFEQDGTGWMTFYPQISAITGLSIPWEATGCERISLVISPSPSNL
ncbi:hypothetical protein B0H17DRAFT_1151001 [Mycena rosella]|uniref:Uncharacterized protein n=1 Tax=Mycena rosella TaxID=1033263 RepID=A0AAD7BP14_MYCRO|nr:hypothetical protein B0H17DRAFT_1151001 [Mycena rosella]